MGYWSFLDTGLVPCIIPGCFGRRRGKRTRFGGFFYVWWLPVFPGCQAGQAAGLSSPLTAVAAYSVVPEKTARRTGLNVTTRHVYLWDSLPRIARLAEHF